MALRFKISKKEDSFIIKAVSEECNPKSFKIWYRKDKFWHKWQFVGISSDFNSIEEVIYYHFGFTSIIQRIS